MSKSLSKKSIALIAGGGAILLLTAALVLLLLNPPKEAAAPSSAAAVTTVKLIDETPDELQWAKITNEKDEYVVEPANGESWMVADLAGLPLQEGLINGVKTDLATVTATQTVAENASNLSDFGFDRPYATVEARFKNGNTYALTLGALSSDKSSRYLIETGKSTVYALSASALGSLSRTRWDYLSPALIEAGVNPSAEENSVPPELKYFRLKRPDLEQPILLEPAGANGQWTENSSRDGMLQMTSPGVAMLSEEQAVQPLLFSYPGMAAAGVFDAILTEEKKALYGFDEPSAELELRYSDGSSALLKTGKGLDAEKKLTDDPAAIAYYLVLRSDMDMAYYVAKADAVWMTLQTKSLVSTLLTLPNIKDVSSIDITSGGKKQVLTIIPTVTGEGEDAKETQTFTLDEKPVDADNARTFYQLLLSTRLQDVYLGQPEGSPAVTIQYNQRAGDPIRVDVYVQEDLSTLLALNGAHFHLGRPGFADKIAKEALHLAAGEPVDADW